MPNPIYITSSFLYVNDPVIVIIYHLQISNQSIKTIALLSITKVQKIKVERNPPTTPTGKNRTSISYTDKIIF